MRIRIKKEFSASAELYILRFAFPDFTDEEKFLFNKYGFISVTIPRVNGAIVETDTGVPIPSGDKYTLDTFVSFNFFFKEKEALNEFQTRVVNEIQEKLGKYLKDLDEFVGEDIYEVTMAGEIRKINEGAKKALDKTSPEYKEIIEMNREAFQKLSEL